jgi:uncharacterized membrane protein
MPAYTLCPPAPPRRPATVKDYALLWLLMLLWLVALPACGSKLNPGGNCPLHPGPVTFGLVQTQVLTYCTPCHRRGAANRFGATASVNFETYDDAVNNADEANMDILSGRMPPGSAVDPNLRCLMDAWIKNNHAR